MKKDVSWTPTQARMLHEMVANGHTFSDIGQHLGRSADSCRHRHYNDTMRPRHGNAQKVVSDVNKRQSRARAYNEGLEARNNGAEKRAPYDIGAQRWSWLAGWHDADMEAGVSYIDQLEGRNQ